MAVRRTVQVIPLTDGSGDFALRWDDGSSMRDARGNIVRVKMVFPPLGSQPRSGPGFTCGHCHKRITDESMGKHISGCDPAYPAAARKRRLERDAAIMGLEVMIAELDDDE